MTDLSNYTKAELQEIASWYGVDLPSTMYKDKMIKNVEVLLSQKKFLVGNNEEEVPMSVQIRRIKEANNE
jgi:hypothetical protein